MVKGSLSPSLFSIVYNDYNDCTEDECDEFIQPTVLDAVRQRFLVSSTVRHGSREPALPGLGRPPLTPMVKRIMISGPQIMAIVLSGSDSTFEIN